MKKNNCILREWKVPGIQKLLMVMKLTIFLLLMSVANVFAAKSYSQTKTLNLNMDNSTVKEVLQNIEEQSEFYFMYSEKIVDVNRKVSVNVTDKKIKEVLNDVFENTNVKYTIKDRFILLNTAELDVDGASVQQNAVNGKITDETGQPLPGVTVVVKGTTKGAVSNIDGEYTIAEISANDVLVFSFVGMLTQEITVGDQTSINVTMAADAIGLDEVVAIGYGTTTKRKMVSSISSVETEEIAEAPYTSVMNGLAGRSAGLFVRESGGEYGSVPTISIRGGGEPAYVIDGILASAREFASIPPEDIEKVSFLKDASAAAVYGFNSADGVVLITTKQGKDGEINITYGGNVAFQQPTLIPEYLSPYETAVMKNQAAFNDGLPQIVDDETLNILKNNLEPVLYPTASPFDEAVKNLALQQRHNISLSGSVKNTRVYMSLDYFNQEGIYKSNDHGLNRYSVRTNISQGFDKIGLTVTGNVSLQRGVQIAPPLGSWEIFSHVRNWGTGQPLYNPSGQYTGLLNPIAEADTDAGYSRNENNLANTRIDFTWKLPWVKGLTAKAIGNYRFTNDLNKVWRSNLRSSAQLYMWDDALVDMGPPSLFQSTGRSYQYDIEGHLNYVRTFDDKHTIDITGVYTESEWRWDGFEASRKDYVSSAVDQLFAGSTDGAQNNGNASEGARRGYVGRLKYDYDAKYVVEGNFRYDGNDNFPDGKRYGFFPSVSLGWNMDREPFIQSVIEKIAMNSLKLRASWGVLGSDAGLSRFGYITGYQMVNNRYYIDGTFVSGFQEGPLVSSNTTWFDMESRNLGLDYAFLEGKVSGSFDWFYYRTTGFLGSPSDRYTTPLGKELPQINTNSAKRRGGIEATVNYHARAGEATIDVGFNISYYDQLWEKMYDEDTTSLKNPYSRLTHQKDYYTRGYIDGGLFGTMEEIINSPRPLGSTQTMPGDIRYEDFNGDGRIDNDDLVRIGKSDFPHIIYGLTLGVNYKGFSLNTLFQGTSNRQIYLGYMWQNEINHKLYEIQSDSWSTDNPNSLFPRTSTFSRVNGANNTATSSYWLQDAWYLRMKSLALSYDLKSTLLKQVDAIDNLSLILSATNVFTISPLNKYYMDPETSSSENYGYPVQRTFNVGVRVSF